jgi:hypothetical protein
MLPCTSQLSRSRLPSCCSRDLEISSTHLSSRDLPRTPRLSSHAHTLAHLTSPHLTFPRSAHLTSPQSLRTPCLSSVVRPSRELQRREGRHNAAPRVAVPSLESQRCAASRSAEPRVTTPCREMQCHAASRLTVNLDLLGLAQVRLIAIFLPQSSGHPSTT